MDIFSIPEMTLLAVANHFFISNKIEYDPVHLFKDVSVRTFFDSKISRAFFFFRLVGPPTRFLMLVGTLFSCIGLFYSLYLVTSCSSSLVLDNHDFS